MSLFGTLQKISDPEKWLMKTKLMEIIQNNDFQDSIEWIVSSCPRDINGPDTPILPWSLLYGHLKVWILSNIKAEFRQSIEDALREFEGTDKEECGFYWVVHYSILRAMAEKRVRIKYCFVEEVETTRQMREDE